jgi:dTDP-4-dehydrorhamnose reductase
VKRYLLVGGGGLLGTAWLRWLSAQEEVEVFSIGQPPGRIERNTTIKGLVSVEEMASWKPYAILHLAGPSHYEKTAEDPDKSKAGALSLAQHLVATSKHARAKMVFVSCDRVFDAGTGPFEESAPRGPVTPLGQALTAIEEAVETCDDHLIIRTSALYGWGPHCPEARLTRWIKRWDANATVTASGEILAQPTWSDSLPRAAHAGLRRDGILHIAGPQRMSLYDLARAAARTWDLPPERVRSGDPTPDGLPFAGGLVAERFPLPTVQQSLPDIRRQFQLVTNL